MRIGISTSVIQRGRTGIAQYLFSLLDAFANANAPHEFFLFVLEQDRPLFEKWKDCFRLISVDEAFRPPIRNIVWHQTALPKLAREYRLDLLHIPSYRRMLWTLPCPTIATIHDLAPFRVPAKYDPLRMIYGRTIVKALARRQNKIIAVSHNTARDLQDCFRIPEHRIAVVHNGIDHTRFTPHKHCRSQDLVAQQYRLPKPFFLYVARLEHPGKNHLRLISAFARFKAASASDWNLVFAGSDWHGAEKIHRAIRQSKVSHAIQALGFVGNESLPDLYRAAHALIYPSLYEGFGLPPVEAMACGCPVISSTRGALAEVVSGAALTINPEDVVDMAHAMHRIATDAGLKSSLVNAGLTRAQCFTWEKAATQTLRVYASVAGENRTLEPCTVFTL